MVSVKLVTLEKFQTGSLLFHVVLTIYFFIVMLLYSITDGATLQLVLAMRGGPINTRRSE